MSQGRPEAEASGYQPKLILCPLCRGNPRLKPWATSPGLSKTPSTKQLLLQGGQVLVHELDGDGAFAYGGGAAFDRVEADVAGDEDAGDAGFQQVGLAFQLPGAGRARLQVRSGEDKAFLVEGDLPGQPVGFGGSADEDEEGVRRARLLPARGLQGDALQTAVAGHGDQLGVGLVTELKRTSPATKMPGTLVSSR